MKLTISWPVAPARTTSGAMYSIVPQNEYARCSCGQKQNYKVFRIHNQLLINN